MVLGGISFYFCGFILIFSSLSDTLYPENCGRAGGISLFLRELQL